MRAASAELSRAWACAVCRATRFAASRPLGCTSCGRTNSYAETAAPAPRARRAPRPVPRFVAVAETGRPAPENDQGGPGELPPAPSIVQAPDASECDLEGPATPWRWAADVRPENYVRAASGWEPWVRVTGDLPRRFLTLVHGPRGTGKSRVLLTVAGGVVRTMRRPVLYVPTEQRESVVRAYAGAVGLRDELGPGGLALLETRVLEEAGNAARELRPALIVIDAFKVATFGGTECLPGTAAEKHATSYLVELAREVDAAIAVVLHMQSDGTRASVGSAPQQAAEIIVSLTKLAEPARAVRLACDGKNRTQPDDETALLVHDRVTGRVLVHEKDGTT